jgi:alpha-mannosidase
MYGCASRLTRSAGWTLKPGKGCTRLHELPQVHIINHTHWDREWFLTSIYTRRWIPGLIDRLEELVAANPDFAYLLDGQTLVIEDLLAVAPEYEAQCGGWSKTAAC